MGFVKEFGLEVMGAGSAQVNGWYHRRDANEGPPQWLNLERFREEWVRITGGRPWYEKDDGCVLFWIQSRGSWFPASWVCISRNQDVRYGAPSSAALPPGGVWSMSRTFTTAESPAPTVRVVS